VSEDPISIPDQEWHEREKGRTKGGKAKFRLPVGDNVGGSEKPRGQGEQGLRDRE